MWKQCSGRNWYMLTGMFLLLMITIIWSICVNLGHALITCKVLVNKIILNRSWAMVPNTNCVFLFSDFADYSNKITQQRATSEYKLLRDCLLILANKSRSDILNSFPDTQPYTDTYQMSFAWYHQAVKGTCTECSLPNLCADFSNFSWT